MGRHRHAPPSANWKYRILILVIIPFNYYYPSYSLSAFVVRVPYDHLTIEARVKVQRLLLRGALRKAHDKGPVGVAKRNGGDHNDMARDERFRGVIAEGVVRLPELDERVGAGVRLSMVDLVDVLHVLVNDQAADVVQGHAELVGGVRGPIYGDVEAIVAHENVHLKGVAWEGEFIVYCVCNYYNLSS